MEQRGKPSAFHIAAYLFALAVGGINGWLFGYEVSGIVLAIVFGIVGAVIASTLVGVIAYLFGYRIAWLSSLSSSSTSNSSENPNIKLILVALKNRAESDIESPEFRACLKETRSDNRELVKCGYQLRQAEQDVFGPKKLIPDESILAIIKDQQPQKRIEAIAEYLDRHDRKALGEPVWPYLLAPLKDMTEIFDRVIYTLFIPPHVVNDEHFDMHFEVLCRMFSFGYVYRIAEELVSNSSRRMD